MYNLDVCFEPEAIVFRVFQPFKSKLVYLLQQLALLVRVSAILYQSVSYII